MILIGSRLMPDGHRQPTGTEDAVRPKSNGLFTARQMAGKQSPKRRREVVDLVNSLDRALFGAVIVGLVVLAIATAIRRSGNDLYVDVTVPVERAETARIDLNTAAWYDLLLLDGIGETLARRIVEDRETNGPLTSIDDLNRVSGIGPKTIERLRANVTVNGTQLSMHDGLLTEPPAVPPRSSIDTSTSRNSTTNESSADQTNVNVDNAR